MNLASNIVSGYTKIQLGLLWPLAIIATQLFVSDKFHQTALT